MYQNKHKIKRMNTEYKLNQTMQISKYLKAVVNNGK